MQITDIHIGQKILYQGAVHTVETIDGRFGTVTFDGITAKAEDVESAEARNTLTLSGWSELALLDSMLDGWFERNSRTKPFYAEATRLRKRLVPVLKKATEALGE